MRGVIDGVQVMVWRSGLQKCAPEPKAALSLADELREYRKMQYIADCGNCQIVPLELLNRAIDALAVSRPDREAL